MSWCSASSTSASCWDRTKDITMTRARTYRWTRMYQCRVQFSRLAASWPSRTWEVYTINTSGFDFR